MGWPFCVSALPPSLGAGYGYASFFRLSGAIKNSHPLFAFTHSFRMKNIKKAGLPIPEALLLSSLRQALIFLTIQMTITAPAIATSSAPMLNPWS